MLSLKHLDQCRFKGACSYLCVPFSPSKIITSLETVYCVLLVNELALGMHLCFIVAWRVCGSAREHSVPEYDMYVEAQENAQQRSMTCMCVASRVCVCVCAGKCKWTLLPHPTPTPQTRKKDPTIRNKCVSLSQKTWKFKKMRSRCDATHVKPQKHSFVTRPSTLAQPTTILPFI